MNNPTTPPEAGQLDELLVELGLAVNPKMFAEAKRRLQSLIDAARLEDMTSLNNEMQRYIDYPIKPNTPFTHALNQARLGHIQMQRLVKERLAQLSHPAPVHKSDKELD